MASEQIENYEETIKKLAILFAKGEISEKTYKTSVQALEEKLGDLKQIKKEPEISEVRKAPQSSAKITYEGIQKTKPSSAWWLVPLLLGIIGGLIAYVGVKNDDREMAENLLGFSILWTLVVLVLLVLFIFY